MRRSFFTASPFLSHLVFFTRRISFPSVFIKKSNFCSSCIYVRKQVQLRFQLFPGEKMCAWGNLGYAEANCHLAMSHLNLFPFPPLFHFTWARPVCFASWHPLELSNNSRNGLAFPLLPPLRDFVIKSKKEQGKKRINERKAPLSLQN